MTRLTEWKNLSSFPHRSRDKISRLIDWVGGVSRKHGIAFTSALFNPDQPKHGALFAHAGRAWEEGACPLCVHTDVVPVEGQPGTVIRSPWSNGTGAIMAVAAGDMKGFDALANLGLGREAHQCWLCNARLQSRLSFDEKSAAPVRLRLIEAISPVLPMGRVSDRGEPPRLQGG